MRAFDSGDGSAEAIAGHAATQLIPPHLLPHPSKGRGKGEGAALSPVGRGEGEGVSDRRTLAVSSMPNIFIIWR